MIEEASRLCRQGKRDQALIALEHHLRTTPQDHSARLMYVQLLRTARQDARATAQLVRALVIPAADYKGLPSLDVPQPAGTDETLRTINRQAEGRLAYLTALMYAEEALLQGRLDEAAVLLARTPPNALPVPWHYLHARLALAKDGSSSAARDALMDAAVCLILMPGCGAFYRVASDACRRLGNLKAAGHLFAESLNFYDRSWANEAKRTAIPVSVLRHLSRLVLLGNPSGARLLIYTRFVTPITAFVNQAARRLIMAYRGVRSSDRRN